MFNYMAIIEILVAAYLLFVAVTGKSKVLASAYTQKGKEALYKKTGRIGFAVIGVLMLALGLVNIYASAAFMNGTINQAQYEGMGDVASVLMIAVLTALFGMYFLFNRLHDKQKKQAPVRPVAPRSAFYFDEEDEPGATRNSKKK